MKSIFLFIAIIFWTETFCQTKDNLENLSTIPKRQVNLSIDYGIALPRADGNFWDKDYASYKRFITPSMSKTQLGMSYAVNGIETWAISNSVIPHAQLDTSMLLSNPDNIIGTWRMVAHRNIRFTDSVTYVDKKIYRSDTILSDVSTQEDAFAFFSDQNLKIYSRPEGKSKFKQKIATTYKLENNRSIMLYKFFKSSGVVGQIGIDKDGLLILNFPAVVENKRPGVYIVYNAIIEQFIFEKVRQ